MKEATLQQWVEKYLERGIAKSLILGFLERGEVDDPKQLPKTASYVADLGSISGIKRELANILENESGRDGYVKQYARLNYAQIKKKEAQQRWQTHLNSQPNLPKATKPSGHWAIDIARWRAVELVCKRESRALNKRLRELEQVEEENHKRKVRKLRFRGIGKIRNGVLSEMDGRKVLQKDGRDIFEDDASLVCDYLQRVKQIKKKKAADKKAAAREGLS